MKKIVPLTKNLNFKTNLAEITSIALDHELNLEGSVIKGNLVISGSYKMNDTSINIEEFKYNIPVNIEMSDKYILDKLEINIDDFYYEIINNNVLNVNIEIGLDKLEEKAIPPFKYEEKVEMVNIEEIVKPEPMEVVENLENRISAEDVKTLFDSFDDSTDTYSTYKVCIVKENDTVETILTNYNVTRELLETYNDISDLKIGDKLIIPATYNAQN